MILPLSAPEERYNTPSFALLKEQKALFILSQSVANSKRRRKIPAPLRSPTGSQGVSIDALRLPGEPGAGLELGVEILQHREDRAGDVGHHLPVQPARGLGSHHPARARHQQIVERVRPGILLGDLDARIVVQIEIVERAALERGGSNRQSKPSHNNR